ncbi:unnamed protein product [Adineta ricciae]|uniref:ARID domain-containing protein n=1 Tax=Adineta ricciae TaxID=249248 RepID=A0A814ZX82_ADIRI|nr:unnamed protein product [Adineta ricciae]CAF1248872.1 unnamed protein product [Adineta ricciae]
MTTYAPIQPRPIISKPVTINHIQYSASSHYPVQTGIVPNNNGYPPHSDVNPSIQTPSVYAAPLSPSEEFLKRLRDFHRGRQTAFRTLPTIAGQVVDLYVLFNTVMSHGGWEKVHERQLWSTVASHFSIDDTCLNGTQALKNIYIRYLYAYEKVSNGENIDAFDGENDDAKRRTYAQLQRVPQSYNYAQHAVPEGLRAQHGLFTDFVPRTEFEKLELALLCGFPNEITFTLNTLLLLSSSPVHSKSFHLYKCPRLLNLLYRHVGLFSSAEAIPSDHQLKSLYENLWSKHADYHMDSFWIESCSPSLVKLFFNIDTEDHSNLPYKNFNSNFNLNQQEQEFRVEQILMIIRNLSFDRVNALFLLETLRSSSSLTYRLLLLMSSCQKHVELQKYALDIWSNLALYMHLRMISNDEGYLLRQLLISLLNGNEDENHQQDRLEIIRALEILSNLAQAGNDNGMYLIDYVNIIVKHLLHIPDILVLVHTLECLYQLSELGEQLCDAILNVESSSSTLSTLIDLLTIEARSFSSQTIKTIKIVEMSSGPVLLPSYHQPPKAPQSVVLIPTNQPTMQYPTYTMENFEMNKTNPRFIIQTQPSSQQHSKPLIITDVLPSGSVLTVTSTPTNNISTVNDKKRKLDANSDSLVSLLTESSKRPTSIPSISLKIPVTSSTHDEINPIQSAINEALDHCSSLDNDVRACVNDLCQRVSLILDQSLSSPVFKRKIQTQPTKEISSTEEQTQPRAMTTNSVEKKEDLSYDYICEWDNCRAAFPTARSVLHHICSSHIKYLTDYVCLWNGCDRLKRQKWALISHVHDRHCSEAAFRQAKLRSANPVPPATITINTNRVPTSTTNSMSYASDAAWLAIRRHMQVNLFEDQINKSKEGPLTKSIRLTAALILRNLARHSSIGKQNLRQYEQLLANLTLESLEASHILSSCLFELYN